MKKNNSWFVIPATVAMLLALSTSARSNPPIVQVSPQMPNDPMVVNGTSGGSQQTDCGYIAPEANQVLRVSDRINYLRITVESAGSPTLLVNGPGGRFCILADNTSGDQPEISGVWETGDYSIFVGDREGGQHPYTLSLTQKQ